MTTGLPDYPEALAAALRGLTPIGDTQRVGLADAERRVLRQPIVADRDLPPFNRSQLDGYAVRAAEVGRLEAFGVAATIAAGQPADVRVPAGQCVAIATGAPLPDDVDAVVPHELSDRGDPVRFTIAAAAAGDGVHPRGADASAGAALVAEGTVLAPQHLGIAASVGATHLNVARRPQAIVLTSGDEVRPADAAVADHQIRNSNGPMISAMLDRIGAVALEHVHVVDELDDTTAALGAALSRCDLVATVGGVSAGERDWFPKAFETHGVMPLLQGAGIQPGKPIRVGRTAAGVVVVALPGNPVSAMACTCLFIWPIVRGLLGLDTALPWRRAELGDAVKPNPKRRAFRPAIMEADGVIRVPRWAGSGDLAHTAPTHGLAELPVQADAVPAGADLRFLPWP